MNQPAGESARAVHTVRLPSASDEFGFSSELIEEPGELKLFAAHKACSKGMCFKFQYVSVHNASTFELSAELIVVSLVHRPGCGHRHLQPENARNGIVVKGWFGIYEIHWCIILLKLRDPNLHKPQNPNSETTTEPCRHRKHLHSSFADSKTDPDPDPESSI